MPAVSVIVLVYKVEEYIEQCARALFEQTLEDLEYIFVDDCTPDASMQILERVLEDYPARRGQVKILHNEVNRGQAYSRRKGIESATGDYIIHCDSDDWPDPVMYEKMYAKAVAEKLDMVICDVRRIFSDHFERVHNITHTKDLLEDLCYHNIYHYLPNKLISRRVYECQLSWPVLNMCEDSCLILQMAPHCHNWGILDEELYNYRFNPNSISNEDTQDLVEQIQSNLGIAFSSLDSLGLSKKYERAIRHLKYWAKSMAIILPWSYYLHLFPEINLPILFDRSFTKDERLGHLTKLMGIHGVSKVFSKK